MSDEGKSKAEKEKRRMSSDGQTPKPSTKMPKMADGNESDASTDNDFETRILEKLTVLAESVRDVQKGQKELRSSFDKKMDKFRNEFMANIEDKFKAVKSDFDLELGKHQSQIDTLSRSVESLIDRIQRVENRERPDDEHETGDKVNKHTTPNPLSDPDRTIIASNVSQSQDEDIFDVAQTLVSHLSESATVVAAARLRSRISGKPGLVKICLQSVDEKIEILRKKRDLLQTREYRSVFIRSSKSHAERLIELNAKTILSQIPSGNLFRITSNGRIVKKSARNTNTQQNHDEEHY